MKSVLALILSLPLAAALPLPGFPAIAEITLPDGTAPSRAAFIKLALQEAAEHQLNRYIFGSADPSRGGFDCSGSVYYLLEKSGIDPPRSSSAQYDWIKKAGKLVTVPPSATTPGDPIFSALKPGDLLFWGGTYEPTDGRTNGVTHVQIYLGRQGARHVMIGSTDGRTYQGTKRCGFGTFDFKLPRAGSKSRFLGYGTPPGLADAG